MGRRDQVLEGGAGCIWEAEPDGTIVHDLQMRWRWVWVVVAAAVLVAAMALVWWRSGETERASRGPG